MSELLVLRVYWTKETDSKPHQRVHQLNIRIPVTNELSELDDQILALDRDLLRRENSGAYSLKLPGRYKGRLTLEKMIIDAQNEVKKLALNPEETKAKNKRYRVRAYGESWLCDMLGEAEELVAEKSLYCHNVQVIDLETDKLIIGKPE